MLMNHIQIYTRISLHDQMWFLIRVFDQTFINPTGRTLKTRSPLVTRVYLKLKQILFINWLDSSPKNNSSGFKLSLSIGFSAFFLH